MDLEGILYKLPVKSLMRFRCVHKYWNSLISDPKFARRHLRESNRHNLIVDFWSHLKSYPLPLSSSFNRATPSATQLDYPVYNDDYHLIVGSCDGIILFWAGSSANDYFLLWNPSIRTFMELPTVEQMLEGDYLGASYGFGYNNLNETYKVVSVFFDVEEFKSEVMVHTLGTNCWRRVEEKFPSFSDEISGKFVSGTINWLSFDQESIFFIVSLDLGKESFQKLSYPNVLDLGRGLSLGVLRNCLCLVSHDYMFCDVWVMMEHGNDESWTKMFNLPHHNGDVGYYPLTRQSYISEDDDDVLWPSISNLVICNYGTTYFKDFKFFDIQNGQAQILPKISDEPVVYEPEVYAESLISPYPQY